jgi:hypothetical protein
MNHDRLMPSSIDQSRRAVLQVIIAASPLATLGGWYVQTLRAFLGRAAPTRICAPG